VHTRPAQSNAIHELRFAGCFAIWTSATPRPAMAGHLPFAATGVDTMPRKRRINKAKEQISEQATAWLEGKPSGFFQFKPNDELQALWDSHGDTDSMFWCRDMSLPITLEDLEANEDAWLNSGDDDEYGFKSFFVYKYYSDDEKQALWDDRGDKERFRWQSDMRRPELA
jgi:hypothetical protein